MLPFFGGSRLVAIVALAVLVAIAARIIWWALGPMMPLLIGLVIAVVVWKIFYRRT